MIQQWKLTDRDSAIFTAMKTVAMLMVLVIHADLRSHGAEQTLVTDFYNELFSGLLASAAVPIFFFISGFFLFRNFDFKRKFKSRINSIYIPYFIWCTWGVCILFILQGLLGLEALFSGRELKLLRDFTAIDYFRVYWDIRNGDPITSTLWFLRDLCLMVLLSPLINVIIKRPIWGGMFLFVLFLLGILGISNQLIGFFSVFYLSLGGWAAYRGTNLFEWFDRNKTIILTMAVIVFSAVSIAYTCDIEYYGKIKTIWIILCIPLLYFLCSMGKVYESSILLRLSEYSFFIYLFHEPIMGYIQKIWFKNIHLPVFSQSVLFWLFPLLILLVSIFVYKILKRYCPRLLKSLIGGRIKT